jgi:predicted negative regulator of RcsB-dependent stress response
MDAPDLTKSESSLDTLLGETLNTLLGETSWLLSHAHALADYGRTEEADAELERAVSCDEQAAYLLDAVGREQEAVIHRVRAAACCERLGERARAVTLLRAALSARLADDYRRSVEQRVAGFLAQAKARTGAPPAPERRAENGWRMLLKKKRYSVNVFWGGLSL